MKDWDYFISLRKNFEDYFKSESFVFEKENNFYGFSFKRSACSQESLGICNSEKSLLKFIRDNHLFVKKDFEISGEVGFLKLDKDYSVFVNSGKNQGEFYFIFFKGTFSNKELT